MLELSQIIYGVQDLEAATSEIEALGLTVVDGGRHPGLGTGNRIVPLGAAYFELLGVVDRQEAESNPYGRALLQQTRQGNRLVRWSLRTDEIESVARERGLRPEKRARWRPDGVLLTWQAAGLDLALKENWLPFFMQWDNPEQYPGLLPVQHALNPQGIAWLELTPGDPTRLERWLGSARVPLRYVAGAPGLQRVGLNTPAGTLILPLLL